jgi:prolipoprotein diacylglyceryltransferase
MAVMVDAPAAGVIAALFGLWFLLLMVFIAGFIFQILMLVDCAQRNFKGNDKVVWILLLVFLGVLGAALYYFMVKRKRKK